MGQGYGLTGRRRAAPASHLCLVGRQHSRRGWQAYHVKPQAFARVATEGAVGPRISTRCNASNLARYVRHGGKRIGRSALSEKGEKERGIALQPAAWRWQNVLYLIASISRASCLLEPPSVACDLQHSL